MLRESESIDPLGLYIVLFCTDGVRQQLGIYELTSGPRRFGNDACTCANTYINPLL